MRITLINQFYVPDIAPTGHLSASLAEGLVAEGHEVTVVTSQGGYVAASQVERAHAANPRIYRLWTPKLGKSTILTRCIDYASFYLLAAWRLVRLPRQDVIIALTTPPYIAWVGWLHRLLHPSTKLVLWSMDCYPDAAERAGVLKHGGLLSRLMRLGNRALFRRLDHLICLDEAMVELLGQYRPAHPLPTTVIPNWERAELFPSPESSPPPAWPEAEKLGLTSKFVVLYLGNTGVGHPFDAVMEAARQLRDDDDFVFLFVGGGKRWSWLQETKERLGLTNVILHGYVQKEVTASVMASADCALITLDQNMLGVMSPSKMHANLANHLPILYVGPQTSNVDEAIKRFECGVSLRDDDVDGILHFLRTSRAKPSDRAAMRTRAREAFDTAYCDRQTHPQFFQILSGFDPQKKLSAPESLVATSTD